MSYYVKKIEWEYGEQYGHVFYPRDLEDVQSNLSLLEDLAVARAYPFYVEIFFEDDSYLGLIVGHALSCFTFGVFVSDDHKSPQCRTQFDRHYDEQKEAENYFIEYSFKGDQGEKQAAEMLPKEQAYAALYYYIEKKKFPSYIRLGKQMLRAHYSDE